MSDQRPPTPPQWAVRIQAERQTRGWGKRKMARELLRVIGSPEEERRIRSLARQLRNWELGKHFPRDWALAYATVFAMDEAELFGVAQTRDTFGKIMCGLMARRGVRLQEVAEHVGHDVAELARISHDLVPPGRALADRLDAVLGAEGRLSAKAPEDDPEDAPGGQPDVAAGPYPFGVPVVTVGATETVDDRDDDVRRRAALQFMIALGAGTAVPPGALEHLLSGIEDVLERPLDLAEWERAVQEYGPLMDSRPVGAMVKELAADIVTVGELLERHRGTQAVSGLLRVSAGLSGLLAEELDHLGERGSARTVWSTARRAADTSGDRDLAVYVRAREAQVGFYAVRPGQVISDLADSGIARAGGAPSPGLARAHAGLAVLAASQGDDRSARAELATVSDMTGDFTYGWRERNLSWLTAYVDVMAGDKGTDAAIDRALTLFPSGTLGPVTNLHLMRALNLVKNRDIDQGLSYGIAALQQGDPTGNMRRHLTGRILHELPDKARTLPAARELHTLTAVT
ncbi:XRE family transcriptional regulator [Actinomadura viridis]|uniref:XRE family transcriptional regulator n=1 Tax=Actinomadura viridis TaxID=58110 RepID=UPI003677AEA1